MQMYPAWGYVVFGRRNHGKTAKNFPGKIFSFGFSDIPVPTAAGFCIT